MSRDTVQPGVWCEYICDACGRVYPGTMVRTVEEFSVYRTTARADAERDGWVFDIDHGFCSAKCRGKHSNPAHATTAMVH